MLLGKVKDVLEYKGWRFFESGFYNINLIGIRDDSRKAGRFDDLLLVAYKDPVDGWVSVFIDFTTDAGLYWLRNPFTKHGTAVMLPNQYRGAYKLGIHGRSWASGGYPALEQNSDMLYIRDGNKDDLIDLPPIPISKDPATHLREQGKTIYKGNLKTNIHRAGATASDMIGRASAGCQVIKNVNDFNWLMSKVKDSIEVYGWRNSFTYTLIHESWLKEV